MGEIWTDERTFAAFAASLTRIVKQALTRHGLVGVVDAEEQVGVRLAVARSRSYAHAALVLVEHNRYAVRDLGPRESQLPFVAYVEHVHICELYGVVFGERCRTCPRRVPAPEICSRSHYLCDKKPQKRLLALTHIA